jgi:hypothetical protein
MQTVTIFLECDYASFELMMAVTGLSDTARDYTLQLTVTHIYTCHVFTSRYLVAASNNDHAASSVFRNYPWPQLPSPHSNNSPQLEPQQSSNSLTNCSFSLLLLITSRHGTHRKHLSCCSANAVETCLFAEALLRNGRCTTDYFTVVA